MLPVEFTEMLKCKSRKLSLAEVKSEVKLKSKTSYLSGQV